MENNKKNINCIINSKQIKIRNYITFSAFCVYEEFNQDKNVTYRDLFCRIIYSNVLSEDEKKVDIEEIMNLSHKELIGIGYEIVNNDEKLKIHFNSLVEEDFFTKFILSCDLYSQQIKEGMKEFLTLFVGKIQPLEGVSEKLGKVLNKELGEVLSRTGKLVAGVYEAVSKIGMQIYSFIEAAKNSDDIFTRYSAIMIELDWIPTNDLPLTSIAQIVKMAESCEYEPAKKEVDRIMLDYYSNEELKDKLTNWKNTEWLNGRIPILEQVIKAHLDGNYYLTVPSIIPQLEGIIAERFLHEGRITYEQLKQYVGDIEKHIDINYFHNSINKYMNTVLWCTFKFGKPIKSTLSRHAILHGGDTKYGTEENSLRAILLFDYFQDALSDESILLSS